MLAIIILSLALIDEFIIYSALNAPMMNENGKLIKTAKTMKEKNQKKVVLWIMVFTGISCITLIFNYYHVNQFKGWCTILGLALICFIAYKMQHPAHNTNDEQ